MNRFFVKLISVLLIMTLFGSCMTVAPENRSEVAHEFQKLGTVSISKVPLENPAGPVFRISSQSNNLGLMVAGQMGLENNYKYFVMINDRSDQFISGGGYMYQGTGGSSISTSIVYTITIAYTNDENLESKYNVYDCSSLMDGYTFVTKNGRAGLWTLFGITLAGGTGLMLSALDMPDWNDPNYDSKMDACYGRLIGGGVVMLGSLLFTIPLW
ncbi:MAG: hypothetical protein LBH20_06020 [Treponema sp.]|jgi:hypothetical protein|nr:hypothetical protein [Treponema sp.]